MRLPHIRLLRRGKMLTKLAKWWLRRKGYMIATEDEMRPQVMIVPVSQELFDELLEHRDETIH